MSKSITLFFRLLLLACLLTTIISQRFDAKNKKNPKENPDEIGNRKVDKGINLYSIEQEITLGRQVAQEVERTAKLIDDSVIPEYVNRIGQNLVRHSDSKMPFTIKVLDADEINAFALPGGFLFVNSGLLLMVDSESEFAGVMAHEIAHGAARHGTKQASRAQIANWASLPLIFLGGLGGYGTRQVANLAIPVAFMKFSRSFEDEADDLGVQYLYATGYDPDSLVQVFEKLMAQEKKKRGTLAKIFADHSPNEDRIKKIQQRIETFEPKLQYAINTDEFLTIKERLINLMSQHKSKIGKDKNGQPTLRRPTSDKVGVPDKNSPDDKEEGERPKLKRKS